MDTVLKLTECSTDIEVIIKQVIPAVPGNFLKFKFSSDRYWRKCIFLGMPLKREGCITEIEIFVRRMNEAVYSNFWKIKFISV